MQGTSHNLYSQETQLCENTMHIWWQAGSNMRASQTALHGMSASPERMVFSSAGRTATHAA